MINISSNDVATGVKYNGTYNLSRSVQGTYVLTYQNFTLGDIPWVYTGCNTLFLENYNNLGQQSTITFPEMSDDDEISVRAWFTTGVATTGWVTVSSSSYDADTNIYTFIFSGPVLIRYDPDDSSIGYVFNWVYADPLPPGNPIENTLQIDGRYIRNDPKILEIHSADISSEAYNVNGDNPAFFISTNDNIINNQQIEFASPKSSCNLKIYRPANHGGTVPITNNFELIFKPL